MKILKLNQKGITHLLAPIAFVGIFAAIGGVVIVRGHAAATTEYVGGLVRLDRSSGALVNNATVTLRLQGGSTTYSTKSGLVSSAPGYYQFPNQATSFKVTIGKTYVMSAYKVINNTKFCSGHQLVDMYPVGGTGQLREKDFVISDKPVC